MNSETEKQIIERSGVDQSNILEMQNVQSYYPGTKVSNGVDTGEECMIVGVVKKVNKGNLKSEDLVPDVLDNGVKTDVIEESDIQRYGFCGTKSLLGARAAPYGPCTGHVFGEDQKPFKKIRGGVSIGPSLEEHHWTGTLGIVARDKDDGSLVGLTNNHVLGDYMDPDHEYLGCYSDGEFLPDLYRVDQNLKPIEEKVIQTPSYRDANGTSMRLGTVKKSVPTKWGKSYSNLPSNKVDAGTIRLDPGIQPVTYLQGLLPGPFKVGEARQGERVAKSGRTTGVTGLMDIDSPTRIVSSNYTVGVYSGCGDGLFAKFSDCIKFTWNPHSNQDWEWFSYAGDSGSAVLMNDNGEHKLVGLLFAGTHFQSDAHVPNPPYGTGVACKIQNVFEDLNLEAWDGKVVCDSSGQFINIDGQCYINTENKKNKSKITHSEFTPHDSAGNCLE
jgi:hypothetical protein